MDYTRKPATAIVTATGDDPLFADFVYVIGIKRFVHLPTMASLDREQIDALFAADRGKGTGAADEFLRSVEGRRMDVVTYRPDRPRFTSEGPLTALNTHRGSDLMPEDGDCGPWLELVEHVIPDRQARDHFLDWSACLVQKPGVKINHAYMLGSIGGIGKDTILVPVIDALGPWNVGTVGPGELNAVYNNWAVDKTLLLIEELHAFTRRDLANKLKPLLAAPPDTLRINEKYVPGYSLPNLVNTFVTTNYRDPLTIEPGDRRFFFYFSEANPKGEDYYTKFYAWAKANAGRVYGYLLLRDTQHFNPKAAPPKTASKSELIEASRGLLDQHVKALIDDERIPGLVTLAEVMDALPAVLRSTTPHRLGRVLRELGGKELRRPRLLNGARPRVWATCRPELYAGLSEVGLGAKYAELHPAVVVPAARQR